MVLCLKHVGITDWVRERLKMSVKSPASWSVHALSKRPGNPFWPCGFLNVSLFKGHIAYGERENSDALMTGSVLLASK